MKNRREQFYLYWLPPMALCAVIFIQSSFPTPHMGPSFPLKDKVLHMLAYGLLSVLCFRACRVTWPDRLSLFQMLLVSTLFAVLYGLSDELHQAFVPARHADGYDLLADFVGGILGGTIYMRTVGRNALTKLLESKGTD